ncbi:MAG: asparagine synthase (glutamine-hydrolyzing), partial [Candidatus Dadabacteria bacterium]
RGLYCSRTAALGTARLSIVDLAGGTQPIENEDGSLVICMNGEIYNYLELTGELRERGHRFRTKTDTEVALHLFEELGAEFVHKLNGQFAISIWDKQAHRLVLVRDRPGIRPLFYHWNGKRLVFASEIKALFADPAVPRELDPRGIDQVFTFWTLLGDSTCFREIRQLPPGHFLTLSDGELSVSRYWDYPLGDAVEAGNSNRNDHWYAEALRDQLSRAVRLRLRADVPVASYLSGGIDSSVVAFLAQQSITSQLNTYAVEFDDPLLDESPFQREVALHLDTCHRSVRCAGTDIGRVFPDVVRHAEQPLFRTAPAPLYLLSALVHRDAIKVVLTGEGSDEVLWGYDLFKELQIRRFWSKQPDSRLRPLLLRRLYSHHPTYREARYFSLLTDFYRRHLLETDHRYYSHLDRWANSASQKSFYSSDVRAELDGYDPLTTLDSLLPPDFDRYSPVEKAQYLECHTLLPGYLLSSQGDRMSMAHSVEGRYPFLDHEFIEFCARLPARYKLRVLHDKFILRRAFAACLPRAIVERQKHAYQAPEIPGFMENGHLMEYAAEALSESAIRKVGLFDPVKVSRLVAKAKSRTLDRTGTRNNLAFVQILSTQLLHHFFVDQADESADIRPGDYDVAVQE